MSLSFNGGQIQDGIPTFDPRRSKSHDKVIERAAAWSVVNNDISEVLWFYKLPKLPANRAVIMQDTGSYARSGKTFKVKQRSNSQLTDVAG